MARNRERFVSNLKLSYQITDYLEFETSYSIDYENFRFSQFVDTDWLDEENSTFLNGFISQTRFNSRADNISATLAFDKYVNDNLNLKVKVNYFHENRNNSSINASGTELGITGLNTLDNVILGSESIGSSRFNIVANGFSIISAFDYKDRYLIDFLIRNDGLSLFGPNVRNQNFYRFSGAYRISEDLNLNGIDEWKIRGSFGTSGLRPPFSAQYETYNVSQGTATKSTIGNDDLGPYFSTELEVETN